MEDEKTENLVVEDTTENVGEQATEEVVEGEKTTTEPIVCLLYTSPSPRDAQ